MESPINTSSICSFKKASVAPNSKEAENSLLKKCLSFLDNFQRAVELKVINEFLKEFLLIESSSSTSTIPVQIFQASNLISSHSLLLQDYLAKSLVQPVLLDCSLVCESKTDFFAEIFKGILDGDAKGMKIMYDFTEFLSIYNGLTSHKDIVIIFNNASQLNLSYLDDFVRLWERKSKEFNTVPQLKFIFDDSVSFLGMEARLRDRFTVKQFNCPSVKDVFNELIEEIIRNDMPIIFHPQLMKRFVNLSSSESFNSILKQIKFLIISNCQAAGSAPSIAHNVFKDVYLYISGLSRRLKSCRQSSPLHSPTRDFYPAIFDGILVESQPFNEIINELKSCSPNDFASIMNDSITSEKSAKTVREFVATNIVKAMKDKMDTTNSTKITSSILKDFQLDLIKKFSDHLREIRIEIPSGMIVLKDEKGNVRRAFEADPLFALQVALKYPSVYLNCKDCSITKGRSKLIACDTPTSSLNTLMSPIHHNRPCMPDTCLLYRLSLEFCSKSVNLMAWYISFLSVIEAKKPAPLHTARFFKALNELQLIGMVSEFGRSKRRRKFVDRYNMTDSLGHD